MVYIHKQWHTKVEGVGGAALIWSDASFPLPSDEQGIVLFIMKYWASLCGGTM
ncbi:hypothetical protein [Paenibacillus sp. FSL H7-0331]|uniref:hypothetical protein n=1 Tax=Paenibacillus sp. FSL H7-0331 TaxID=1920421 RepID=UPI0015C39E65|nr:hypothetical protein [Paenibacillus sp. FSL H7-0331]